jgi:hypothetical protein
MTRFIIALLFVASLAQHSFAVDDEIVPQQQTHLIDDRPAPQKLLLFPAPEPRIAFEHHLLPQESEMLPGNAASLYGVASTIYLERRPEFQQTMSDMNEEVFEGTPPITEFPIEKAKKILGNFETCLDYVRYASLRKECTWGTAFLDQKEDWTGVILYEVDNLRKLMNLLALEARVAVYENRPLDALKSIRTGYALARHLGNNGTCLVETLVASRFVDNMNRELWYVMQHPDCPNLYWSLAELPCPIFDWKHAVRNEAQIFRNNILPEASRIEKESLTEEEYTGIYLRVVSRIQRVAKNLTPARSGDRRSAAIKTITEIGDAKSAMPKLYATARTKLLESGYKTEVVNKMGMAEAILIQMIDANKSISGDISKYAHLPVAELQVYRAMRTEKDGATFSKLETIPISSVILPTMSGMRTSFIERQREFAAMRTFEALRMYVHSKNELPHSLIEIEEEKIVTVPNDPVNEKPFEFEILKVQNNSEKDKQEPQNGMMSSRPEIPKIPNPYDEIRYQIKWMKDRDSYLKQLAQDKEAYKAKLAALPPKPKVEPKLPDPRDNEAVAGKDQKYYELAPKDAKEFAAMEAMRKLTMDNIKHIGLAMHTHAQKQKPISYPPAYIADKDGKPLLSWRVMILPYLEEKALYEQFKLDEPWDSEHNKKLIEKMPKVYASPLTKPLEHGKTCYQVPFGKETLFTGKNGIKMREVTDGTSKTIALVEVASESAVEWTKPQDWEFDSSAKEPLKGLFGLRESGLFTGYGDASAQIIQPTVKRGLIKALLTRAGREPINFDEL